MERIGDKVEQRVGKVESLKSVSPWVQKVERSAAKVECWGAEVERIEEKVEQ